VSLLFPIGFDLFAGAPRLVLFDLFASMIYLRPVPFPKCEPRPSETLFPERLRGPDSSVFHIPAFAALAGQFFDAACSLPAVPRLPFPGVTMPESF